MENIIAIIPARGGSKSIPLKNIQLLGDKPLIAWSIEQAKSSKYIKRVFISTDDDRIRNTAIEYGAEIIKRPKQISGDYATSESALIHAVNFLEKHEAYKTDMIVFMQATSPFRPANCIDEAISELIRHNADSLFSACLIEGYIWEHSLIHNRLRPLNYDPRKRLMRQKLQNRSYEENGSFYIMKKDLLLSEKCRLSGKIIHYTMPRIFSYQIDTEEDLAFFRSLISTSFIDSLIGEKTS